MQIRNKRTKEVWDDPARQPSTTPVQMYASSQQVQTRVHGSDHSTMNVYQSQRKNAYNPFSSALADVFGIEEAYS